MKIHVFPDKEVMGKEAARVASQQILEAINEFGEANIILATGTSQFATLNHLSKSTEIDWSKVHLFHLDEYIGISIAHPASFRKYLTERFINQLPNALGSINFINGEAENAQLECDRISAIIEQRPIHVALVGIGENGHLAFNDPPADFETTAPFILVDLDEACRNQQFGEGWFNSLDEVPEVAISMSIQQIMKSNSIICSVPDERKAEAVKNCFTLEVSNLYPASVLRNHADCTVFLDEAAASKLENYG